MKSNLKQKIFISLCLIILAAMVGSVLVKEISRKDFLRLTAVRTIELRADGFFPKQLTIHEGDTVTFVSKTGKPFWPASNIHPSHMLYPEFDPMKPLAPYTSWQFTFNRVGKWRFHDHMHPEFIGTIVVLAPGKNTLDQLPCKEESIDIAIKEKCWEEALSDALETKGVQEVFAVFADLYRTDKDFVTSGCHVHAHRIGDAFYAHYAYRLRSLQGIELPKETMACGYGFYHGLFEHFFRKHPNIALAQTICDDLDRRYGESLPIIRNNCFHGAGHGLIADPPPVELWGKPEEIIQKPLALCEQISTNPEESFACMDGVFNIVSSWMGDKKYGMEIDEKDPFWLCKAIKPLYQHACYYEQIMVMSEFENRDLVGITRRYIEPIQDQEVARILEFSLSAALMQQDVALPSQIHLLLGCRAIAPALEKSCLEGIVNGFRSHGEPGREYERAVVFCESRIMTDEERDICFISLIRNLWYLYPEEKVREICGTFDAPYDSYCEKNSS